jgi:alpha-galactosidase
VKLQGLDATRRYRVEEINLMPGVESDFEQNGKTFTGDYLMKYGLDLFSYERNTSRVVELTAE